MYTYKYNWIWRSLAKSATGTKSSGVGASKNNKIQKLTNKIHICIYTNTNTIEYVGHLLNLWLERKAVALAPAPITLPSVAACSDILRSNALKFVILACINTNTEIQKQTIKQNTCICIWLDILKMDIFPKSCHFFFNFNSCFWALLALSHLLRLIFLVNHVGRGRQN